MVRISIFLHNYTTTIILQGKVIFGGWGVLNLVMYWMLLLTLFRYLCIAINSHSPLSQGTPRGSIGQGKLGGKRCGEARGKKMQVATYASIHIFCTVIENFSKAFGKDLKENMVRDWIKAYNKELQRKCSVTEIGVLVVAELSCRVQHFLLRLDPVNHDFDVIVTHDAV